MIQLKKNGIVSHKLKYRGGKLFMKLEKMGEFFDNRLEINEHHLLQALQYTRPVTGQSSLPYLGFRLWDGFGTGLLFSKKPTSVRDRG